MSRQTYDAVDLHTAGEARFIVEAADPLGAGFRPSARFADLPDWSVNAARRRSAAPARSGPLR